nr:hypothetical protein [Rhodococcus qingshengii]
MSNQDGAEAGGFCSPLVREPLTEDWGRATWRGCSKPSGDPVRCGLAELGGKSRGWWKACVCDISG